MAKENIEKTYKRIEFSKVALKKRFSHIFPEHGVYEIDDRDYPKLYTTLRLIDAWFKKRGYKKWNMDDFDKLPEKLQNLFLNIYYRALNKRINSLSEQSKIFFMIDMHASKIKVNDSIEEIKDVKEVLSRWTKQTMIMLMTGYLGTGKTDFALKISEWLWHHGYVKFIISNIAIKVENTRYDGYCLELSKLSELMLFLYRYKDINKVFVLDEAAIHISHRSAMSSSNKIIMNLSKLLRKLKTHTIIITQRENAVDKEIREFATIVINKESKSKAYIREQFGAEPKSYYIVDVKKTDINFDTNDMADFEFDIEENNFSKIMSAIANKLSYEDFKKLINDIKTSSPDDSNDSEISENINSDTDSIRDTNSIDAFAIHVKLNDNEKNILRYAYDKTEFKRADIEPILSIKTPTLKKYIKNLTDWGFLRMNGSGNKTAYTITNLGIQYVKSIEDVGKND
jgi:predicted transcriptional regulator/N-acetylglutamate synthase-like GNAT family acetyltransferase